MEKQLEQLANYAVLLGSHGNEMEVGGQLEGQFKAQPISGVVYRIAHPEAVALGERYLGTAQIMSCYPGNPNGDPEQKAAYENLHWIRRNNPITVFDIHETTVSGSYFAVGTTTTSAAIAGARMLGSNICLVRGSTFNDFVPEGVSIENSLADDSAENITKRLYSGLKKISRIDLQEVPLDEAISGVTFYQKFEIHSLDNERQLLPYLRELEKIPNRQRFLDLNLEEYRREVLIIPSEASVSYGTWGHHNMSKLLDPNIFGRTATGAQRREYFGSFQVQIAPPVLTADGHVVFQRESRSLSRKPEGLLRLAA